MSNRDAKELPNTRWFDSESDLPGISSVDSTLALGVNMSCPSANQIQARALDFGDNSTTGPVLNKGTLTGNVPLQGTGPSKRESFLDTPTHTPL